MSMLKIDAAIAAKLYLALRRIEDSLTGDCDCDEISEQGDAYACIWCEGREALSMADGISRINEGQNEGQITEPPHQTLSNRVILA